MQPILLPERHKQQDFFIADIFDALPVKNDRHTMEHPFFALSTKPDIRTVHYHRNGIGIKLVPHGELGLPTMFDKDILLYCGSLVIAEMHKNPDIIPPKKLRFSCRDLLITTNRETNGKSYKLLKNAFERLKGVSITTDIKTNDIKRASGFGLIDSWDIIENSHDNKRMVKIEVTLSEWYYNALVAKEVLTINRDYFRLRKGLERRLYEIARKHCGYQTEWKIKLDNLHEKSGSLSKLFKFRYQLREIITNDERENHFPDYKIELSKTDTVTFRHKSKLTTSFNKVDHNLFDLPSYVEQEEIFKKLKQKTLVTAIRIMEDNNIIISLESIIFQFIAYVLKTGEPQNYDAAFIGFVKKKLKSAS